MGASKSVTLTARVAPSAAVGSVLFNGAFFGRLGLASPVATTTTMVLP
jgi:hypothetical protein